jgi:hypothetical protein
MEEGIQVYLMFYHSGQQILMAKVRERLTVNKQKSYRLNIRMFNLKKLNEVEGQRNVVLRSQIGLQLWSIWKLMWILIALGKRLEKIYKFEPKSF